jgi:hypothetical protein
MNAAIAGILFLCFSLPSYAQLTGVIRNASSRPVPNTRVTLFNADTTFFAEARTDSNGQFQFAQTPAVFTIGASALGMGYVSKRSTDQVKNIDVVLAAETEVGRWDILTKAGERFGGTNLAALLPDGRIMYCHDTKDPIIYDPTHNALFRPDTSPRIQGCVAPSLLQDGRLMFIGGTDKEVYGPGTTQVKTYDPVTNKWEFQPDVLDACWYPTLVQLPQGQLLITGGGGLQNPKRINTSEIMNPATRTWSYTDTTVIGNEVSPIVLLKSGEVLMTHRPPQLYNQGSGKWRLASPFVQSPRTPDGDHADHELTELPDGRVVAIGYRQSYRPDSIGHNVEIYDPVANRWSLGADFMPVRSRCKSTLLPNKKILVSAGYKESLTDPTYTNAYGYMSLVDLYDPYANAWSRMAPMNIAREYHANQVLIPDGRVIILGGEGKPGEEPRDTSIIEAFTPPYLLRGIRPVIENFPTEQKIQRGSTLRFDLKKTNSPTSVIIMGTAVVTHFMNCGIARYIELPFTFSDGRVTTTLPTDTTLLPVGFYQLFAMVDDVPSVGKIIQVVSRVSGDVNIAATVTKTGFHIVQVEDLLKINFRVPQATHVRIVVADMLGRTVETIRDAAVNAGEQELTWNPRTLSSGSYLIRDELDYTRPASVFQFFR